MSDAQRPQEELTQDECAQDAANVSEEEIEAHNRFNGHVSYVCTLIALIIGIIVVATAVLGELDYNFAILGLATAVALLALAGLQQNRDSNRRRK